MSAEIATAVERLARRPSVGKCVDIPAGAANIGQGGAVLEYADLRRGLYKALHRLPEDERRAISLRFRLEDTGQLPSPQIGRILGCSASTAFGRVNTALGRLRRKSVRLVKASPDLRRTCKRRSLPFGR